jgi:hypothetical protein
MTVSCGVFFTGTGMMYENNLGNVTNSKFKETGYLTRVILKV